MTTITIGGTDYPAYQTVVEIDAYAAAAVGTSADAWHNADADAKARDGVSSTRLLDRQSWAGQKTDPDQPLAWPRAGVTFPDGSAVPSDAIPQQVLDANSEIAMDLEGGSSMQDDATTANTTRRMKAGSVEIEYFRVPGTGTRFPLAVMELIGPWLGGVATTQGSEAFGACDKTEFEHRYDLTRGF